MLGLFPSVADLNFAHSSQRSVLMKWNVCHWEMRVEDRPEFCCGAIPSLESHEEHVRPPRSSDTARGSRASAKECLRRRTRKKKATDRFPPLLKRRCSQACVCFSCCTLECFWHLGALCKIRCLSVYALTAAGLWTEMEGNPKLFDPRSTTPALLSNGPQVN